MIVRMWFFSEDLSQDPEICTDMKTTIHCTTVPFLFILFKKRYSNACHIFSWVLVFHVFACLRVLVPCCPLQMCGFYVKTMFGSSLLEIVLGGSCFIFYSSLFACNGVQLSTLPEYFSSPLVLLWCSCSSSFSFLCSVL